MSYSLITIAARRPPLQRDAQVVVTTAEFQRWSGALDPELRAKVSGVLARKWNRWYPAKIRLAERLYVDHERSIGKEARCLSQRSAGRTSSQMSL